MPGTLGRNVQSDIETAWAAGFFDGEGCTYLKRDRKHPGSSGIRLEVSQMEKEPLERFHAAVGGLGNINRRKGTKPCWRWTACSLSAEKVGELLWPYLSTPKKDQFRTRVTEKYSLAVTHGYERGKAQEIVTQWETLCPVH